MRKHIYRFEPGKAEGRADWKALLGGKGANLAEMANLGIPVPPGFTITTEASVDYLKTGKPPEGLFEDVERALDWLERRTEKKFGNERNPLLVSVRSGAPSSMPGMMDTILDLGLNERTLRGLAQRSGSERFAYDAYRRLLSMFGDVVLKIDKQLFDAALHAERRAFAARNSLEAPQDDEHLARAIPDNRLGAFELERVKNAYLEIIRQAGHVFPESPLEQLRAAIFAVFESWNNPRARFYRKLHHIPDDWGTAVNVQAMVFGNLGDSSATGVAFTRDPSTGARRFFGEWLPNAQGEDVVAGIRTPRPLAKSERADAPSLEEAAPKAYAELFAIQQRLEHHFRDMQDLEFTIEEGRLYLLQTRNGKRSARAAVKIAVDMVDEGLIHPDEAILRVDADRLQDLLFPTVDPQQSKPPIARGIAASPGAVSGKIVFDADDAEKAAAAGDSVILVRAETSPEDLHGMKAARGILTARGGATSHAAVVARGMGRPCVAGCASIQIDHEKEVLVAHAADGGINTSLKRGDVITIDGSTGHVYAGTVATIAADLGGDMQRMLAWTEKVKRLSVRANADTPEQAQKALEFGAEGIGLCRTEHMFFNEERIPVVREMILARDRETRLSALDRLLPFQTEDFTALFRVMAGRPVNIRLLDPPLHEFLPSEPEQVRELAAMTGLSAEDIQRRVQELHEFNPMLGHRGVRLAISYPEIAAMQFRAILTAACRVQKEGVPVHPEIMVPLVLVQAELKQMKQLLTQVAAQIFAQEGTQVAYEFGTMIELPRAALVAGELAAEAEFFSFGTNDLTQTTLGLSRDDSARFLPQYVEQGLLPEDPFVSLDVQGVGQLVRMASERGRKARPTISLGICGEHGGDPRSIAFCEEVGLSYVSCSPFRVPVARVAAAQASLRARKTPR